MYWEDFRRKAREDRRFKAIKEVKVREKMFKEYVKRLRKEQEKQGTSQQQKEADYIKLLKETREIQPGMRWRDAKLLLEKDPRYHAIESKTLREDLFRDFLEDLQKERRWNKRRKILGNSCRQSRKNKFFMQNCIFSVSLSL